MRFDTSMESLIGIGRSESFADLNNPDFARNLLSSSSNLYASSGKIIHNLTPKQRHLSPRETQSTGNARGRHSFSGKPTTEDPLNAAANGGKPFGISESHNFPPFLPARSFSFLHTKKLNTESFPLKRVFPFGFGFFFFFWPWGFLFRFHFDLDFLIRVDKVTLFGFLLDFIRNTHKIKCYTTSVLTALGPPIRTFIDWIFFLLFTQILTNIILMIYKNAFNARCSPWQLIGGVSWAENESLCAIKKTTTVHQIS